MTNTTTLYFTKYFTSGICKGLKANETMRFASPQLAVEFATRRATPTKKAAGGSNWQVVDFSFQKYWRE